MKRPDGITFLALWHFFLGLTTLGGLAALFTVSGVLGIIALAEEELTVGPLEMGLFTVAAFALSGLAVLFFAVAAGLWRMRPWARVPALVIAALSLVKFPVGTVVGGLTLWYLLRDEGGGLVLRSA